uniref:Uncharacterized protein n=1 Tax=Anguilla anguilla TaxID=7936 RepID=A0A0E9Y2A7_ANGAN
MCVSGGAILAHDEIGLAHLQCPFTLAPLCKHPNTALCHTFVASCPENIYHCGMVELKVTLFRHMVNFHPITIFHCGKETGKVKTCVLLGAHLEGLFLLVTGLFCALTHFP